MLFPVHHSITSSGYNVIRVVLSGTHKYNVVQKQHHSSLFFLVRHSITLSRYSVILIFSSRYVILYRCQETASFDFVVSGTSQYNVVGIQRYSSCSFRYVILYRCQDTASFDFVVSGSLQNNVVGIQRHSSCSFRYTKV